MKIRTTAPLAVALALCLGFAVGAEDGADARAKVPLFDSTSGGKVLLRYKFAPGQTAAMDVEMLTKIDIEASGQQMSIDMPIKMSCKYIVRSVGPEGDATADMTITRMSLSMSSPQGSASYDSGSETAADPRFASVKAMLDVPIAVRVSALGKLLSMDANPMQEAIRRAGAAAMDADDTTDRLVKSSFVMLPNEPIGAGEGYDAGEIVQRLQNMGDMRSKVSYEVLSVSGDGKKALLRPRADFVLDPGADKKIDMTLDSVAFDGWILFDVANGGIERSYSDALIKMTVSQNGQSMHVSMDLRVLNTESRE